MTQEFTISDQGPYLLTDFCGEFSAAAGKRCIDGMREAAIASGRRKVLLDCRTMTGDMPIIARFQVAEYSQKTRGAIDRIALVNRPEVVLPDNFVENVAVNRGVNLKIFTDFDQAERWLTDAPNPSG
jgi:hypothetical protein